MTAQTKGRKSPPKHLKLQHIEPITPAQEDVFDDFFNGYNVFMSGCAGTGKTLLALYLGLNDVMDKDLPQERLYVVRSAVPTREIGFLPGSLSEKTDVYLKPYRQLVSELFQRGDAFDLLTKQKNMFEFITTSYLRGITIENAVIIVDEAQNMTLHELSTVITRCGENVRIIFCGDLAQTDLSSKFRDKTGIIDFLRIIERMKKHFRITRFTSDDIVRSGLVKDFIIASEQALR